MVKPNTAGIPGMNAMSDSLEYVKNLWGSMGLPGAMPNMTGMQMPGMVMPTLSLEEIHKRIADLKAVESWLSLNMSMLRNAIQALEVQAATIATLQAMGQSFSASMQAAQGSDGARRQQAATETAPGPEPEPQPQAEKDKDGAAAGSPFASALGSPAAWWNMLQEQFQQAVGTAMGEAAAATGPSAKSAKTGTRKPVAKKAVRKRAAPK